MKFLSHTRHSRGFGVHSTFGFRFILYTLRQQTDAMYYAETLMPRNRLYRLMIRIIAHLQPYTIRLMGCENIPEIRQAITAADSRIILLNPSDSAIHPGMVIVNICRLTTPTYIETAKELIDRATDAAILIYQRGNHAQQQLANDIDRHRPTMTFTNDKDMVVKVMRADLPHQTIDVKF